MRHTRRSYDVTAQPFAGYGLTLHSDDIARLGLFLARGQGAVNGRQVLDPQLLRAALQRDPSDPGMQAGSAQLRYNNGFWAFETNLENACQESLWIPFMSGYGGISVAILPNRSVFYVFSDHGRFEWVNAAVASNKIKKICE
jgi:CubicO group peptidase (beta-lactamase class C family)